MGKQLNAKKWIFLLLCALLRPTTESAGGAATAVPAAPSDPGWPREFTDGAAKVVLHEPQVDSWKDFQKITARFAVGLTPSKGAREELGALSVEADTQVDLESRIVAFANFKITEISYASAKDDAQKKQWADLTTQVLPKALKTVALERILAFMDKSQINAPQAAILLEPPPILVSTQPAALVIIDGKPVPLAIEKTNLQKIVNTNWDLFRDTKSKQYYLRDDKSWLSTKELTGSWKAVTKLPKDFSKLPATEQYREVRQAAKPQEPSFVKLYLVVDKPSELIVLGGEPAFQPIAGTKLMWVSNTESDLFMDSATQHYYFLTSGRWFRTSELKGGKWTAATTTLPEDFKQIPVDHPRAHVLAAVPGTRQAEEAVIAASIPQVAKIDRKTAKAAEVKYVGEPNFVGIENTGVSYASNTSNDVFLYQNKYYLCLQGIWFIGDTANGPWGTADKIPEAIYSIPPSSPKYNVTYVKVYESTPDTVTYGYTSGYVGMYVGWGVAMWGTGYYYPPYYGYYGYPVYWSAPFYTYGASAWYNPATGAYGRGASVYGPYGGYARGAAYNPSTGRYSWGQAAWGPYGGAAAGGFYNPSTGTWGATARSSNGYQSWGQSVVGRGDQWARTGSYSDSRGSVGAIQGSGGGKAIAAKGNQGQSGFVGKTGSGDVYAGRDGNVYKRDQSSGQWYKNNNGSWDSVNRPAGSEGQGARAEQMRSTRPGGGTAATQPTTGTRDVQGGLNRDASARSWGNYNAQRSQSTRSSTWSGSRGGSMGRSGGGRRR